MDGRVIHSMIIKKKENELLMVYQNNHIVITAFSLEKKST